MSRASLFAIPVSLMVLVAACGGGGTEKVDAEDWVDDLCDATTDLADAEADAYDEYDAVYQDAADDEGDDVRDALYQYVKDYNKALDQFEEGLDEAGQPDVRDGDKVLEAVRQFIKDERRAVDDAEKEAKKLDEDDDDLLAQVDDVFFEMEFGDLLELLEDSDARDGDDIIDLIDENQDCAAYLFKD